MAETSIGVSEDVKQLLRERKRTDETFNGLLRRLADESTGEIWTESEIREVARDEINERVVLEALE